MASTVGVVMSIPGQTVGVSAFTDPLMKVTGLDRVTLANAYLAGTIISGCILPFGGRIIDKVGLRITGMLASVGLGCALLYLSTIDIVIGTKASALKTAMILASGFFFVRFFGQGMLTMVSRTMLGKWFDRRRGLATAIHSVFMSLCFGIAPASLIAWVAIHGWKTTWRQMAIIVGLGMTLFIWTFFRERPEEVGLSMDGFDDPRDEPGAEKEERGCTWKDATKALPFWVVTLALSSQALLITGITFHIADIGRVVNMNATDTAALFFPISLVATITSMVISTVSDYIPVRRVVMIMMIGQGIGIATVAHLDQSIAFWVAAFGIGLAAGCFGPLATISMPRFFGRKELGTINGIVMMSMVIASALGPTLFALSVSVTKSYEPILLGALILPVSILLGSRLMPANEQTYFD